jgi:uncharacterized protein (DUF1697 family)
VPRYVALLRGINVGGSNLIRMADLRACFVEHGFSDVETYIQSGNVLFDGPSGAGPLTEQLETMLERTFDYPACVVLRTRAQMEKVVRRAPRGFGADLERYRCDVLYLKAPLNAAAALASVPTRDGVDEAHAGPGVLYFSRLTRRASQSRLAKIASLPIYKSLTIRSWNTTTKLLAMML